MKIYNYNEDMIFINETEARPNPLEKGKFLIPAKATIEKPPTCDESEEVYFADKWNIRLTKTEQPSKYHQWDDKGGWLITQEDQIKLDGDILTANELIEKANLLSDQEAKIQAEIRKIAIGNLIEKNELPDDYVE